jgi:hypothetical protein
MMLRSGQFRGQKSLGPLEISLEMAHYVVCPKKKNNIPHFQNQQCINSYYTTDKLPLDLTHPPLGQRLDREKKSFKNHYLAL